MHNRSKFESGLPYLEIKFIHAYLRTSKKALILFSPINNFTFIKVYLKKIHI